MNTQKRNPLFTAVSILLLISCAFSLCACAKGNKFVSDGAAFKDKRSKVTYVYAPLSYEAIAIGEESYAYSDNSKFYTIVGQDPLDFVCEESGTVFYNENIELPAPENMNFEYLEICTETTKITVNKTITDTDAIDFIIAEYMNADTLSYSGDIAETVYKLRFADTTLGLYFSVSYLHYAEDVIKTNASGEEINYGKNFIYDRFEGRLVPAPSALVTLVNG